jgi:hypothetical protein
MSGWTATECDRALRAPAGFESEEDGVPGLTAATSTAKTRRRSAASQP